MLSKSAVKGYYHCVKTDRNGRVVQYEKHKNNIMNLLLYALAKALTDGNYVISATTYETTWFSGTGTYEAAIVGFTELADVISGENSQADPPTNYLGTSQSGNTPNFSQAPLRFESPTTPGNYAGDRSVSSPATNKFAAKVTAKYTASATTTIKTIATSSEAGNFGTSPAVYNNVYTYNTAINITLNANESLTVTWTVEISK